MTACEAKPVRAVALRAVCCVARRSSGITTILSLRLACHPARPLCGYSGSLDRFYGSRPGCAPRIRSQTSLHRTEAASLPGDVVAFALDGGMRIADCNREADAPQQREVWHIVPDVGSLVLVQVKFPD